MEPSSGAADIVITADGNGDDFVEDPTQSEVYISVNCDQNTIQIRHRAESRVESATYPGDLSVLLDLLTRHQATREFWSITTQSTKV